MTTTYKAATDEIFGRVLGALAEAAARVGTPQFEMRWPGIETTAPDFSKYWGRASRTTATETQRALSTNVGENGKRVFTCDGLVFVQLFCPQSDAEAMAKGGDLADIFKKAFRKQVSSGKVTFRNARVQELPPENSAIRFNVVAEFEYDELG